MTTLKDTNIYTHLTAATIAKNKVAINFTALKNFMSDAAADKFADDVEKYAADDEDKQAFKNKRKAIVDLMTADVATKKPKLVSFLDGTASDLNETLTKDKALFADIVTMARIARQVASSKRADSAMKRANKAIERKQYIKAVIEGADSNATKINALLNYFEEEVKQEVASAVAAVRDAEA